MHLTALLHFLMALKNSADKDKMVRKRAVVLAPKWCEKEVSLTFQQKMVRKRHNVITRSRTKFYIVFAPK